MKKIHLITILSLFSFSAISQTNISVHLKRSQSNNDDITFIVDTLKIFKNDSLFKKIAYPNSFVLFEKVTYGIYKFQYKNLFDEKVEKIYDVKKSEDILGEQEINLFIDKLQNPKTKSLSINHLKNGESMTIKFRFSGCFNNGADSLKIFNKNEILFLKYHRRKRKLKAKDLEALRKYELELRNLPKVSFVSTSNGINEIISKNDEFKYVEPSFFWNGFEILKENLKL